MELFIFLEECIFVRRGARPLNCDGSLHLLYIFDAFVLDTDRRELRHGSASVDIEPQVFDLLEHLIRNRDRVVSRDELIKSVWGGRHVSESALNTRINAARSAIGDSGAKQRLIKTLPRKGIRFVGETRQDVNTVEGSFRSAAERRPVELAGAYEDRRISDLPAVDKLAGTSLAALPAPLERHRFAVSRETGRAVAAIGILCFAFLTWSYFAHSVQSERRRTNVQVAARLTRVAEQINMISREDDEAVRTLEQWAVDLDPQNAAALARLTFAITTGVLNHWSNDVVTDLHAADQALQNAVRIAPNTMIVRGAQCHILRAMRQFEAAIKVCSEVAHDFSKYPFPH